MGVKSPSSRRAWIEISAFCARELLLIVSPSSRRAWIEIAASRFISVAMRVALLAEGVDRNPSGSLSNVGHGMVALLAEGVDRNCKGCAVRYAAAVALLAEGVDRNSTVKRPMGDLVLVALLAEGVDRNCSIVTFSSVAPPSPSSRRAWIEILISTATTFAPMCRPPRGGRG